MTNPSEQTSDNAPAQPAAPPPDHRVVSDRTIDTHVLNLRKKLEDDPAAPRHLMTVHGVGYRLDL